MEMVHQLNPLGTLSQSLWLSGPEKSWGSKVLSSKEAYNKDNDYQRLLNEVGNG